MGLLVFNQLYDRMPGFPITQESPDRHWQVAEGGMTPPAAYKSNPAANQPL